MPKLTADQQAQLDTHLSQQTYLRVADIASYLDATFSVQYSVHGLTDLLHRMGFVYKKPKVVPGKAEAEAQHAFLSKYETLKQNKGPDDPIYFMDAVHPQQPRRGVRVDQGAGLCILINMHPRMFRPRPSLSIPVPIEITGQGWRDDRTLVDLEHFA